MPSDHTQQQSPQEQQQAKELSLQRAYPPTTVPGYEIVRFLGSGAYGEVWVAVDQNTGRQVAIKFYLHRGGIDWSLLSREVEKLVFLSADRYVVQLLDVGWEAEPPYYVMEYIENGSLEDLLREHGPLPVGAAVELFREIAVGLMHAHGKGVLHCDLKPANVLLDQDHKPRLADFGQSRLSHEQTPALGTLFYMAPEQADLDAVPDARWDVYALGAMLYCLLVGHPPHRSSDSIHQIETATDLEDRLARYRQLIRSSPPPVEHRRLRGVDRALAEIVNRCLAVNPERRYANVQAVLDALEARDAAHYRRPLMVLGFVGPLLLLLVMALFAWRGYNRAVEESAAQIRRLSKESNRFAAKAVADTAAEEIKRYFRASEAAAQQVELRRELAELLANPELQALLEQLADPRLNQTPLPARQVFLGHPARQAMQQRVERLMRDPMQPPAASWFICDTRGTQVAAVFDVDDPSNTVGKNFAWRTYFHGGPDDLVEIVEQPDENGRPQPVRRYGQPEGPTQTTHLSAPFQSTATNRWKVAVSSPIYSTSDPQQLLGVIAITVNIGIFMQFEEGSANQFAVLIDGRESRQRGMILQHPLFDDLLSRQSKLPNHFSQYRVSLDQQLNENALLYADPLGQDPEGQAYQQPYIFAHAPVILQRLRGRTDRLETGLIVLVQESYATAVEPVAQLGQRLLREAVLALVGVVCVVIVLWYFVLRILSEPRMSAATLRGARGEPTPLHSLPTLPAINDRRAARRAAREQKTKPQDEEIRG